MFMKLWDNEPLAQDENNSGCPTMAPYLPDRSGPFPAIIVLPGGGYRHRASHEGDPVCRWLNSIGIAAFLLNYRVSPYSHPTSLLDAKRSARMVRAYARDWNVDVNRVGVLGFSAGGHLAATLAAYADDGDSTSADAVERESCRPNLMILCYPVITMGDFTHTGSRLALLGTRCDDSQLQMELSIERQVNKDTPPAFIWHTVDDPGVPVENSLALAMALRRNGIPFELHLFEHGAHGLGLAENHPEVRVWRSLCEAWLRNRGFLADPAQV
ncbi:alpha/beta hydrolase fold domain-containing protein [Alicyclobacillus herbarius]|uniref:alpha/beta hydrolase fold domain-containing protein n=1 Tax=Alicyclobacillus herbarius TaxID=122960 RepID=UPI0009D6A383